MPQNESQKIAKRKYLQSDKGKAKNREYNRRYTYKHVYGIDLEYYDRLFAEQNGLCAICQKPSNRRLHVDHDHNTGIARGLLCGKCNTRLGRLESNLFILAAIDYLAEHK